MNGYINTHNSIAQISQFNNIKSTICNFLNDQHVAIVVALIVAFIVFISKIIYKKAASRKFFINQIYFIDSLIDEKKYQNAIIELDKLLESNRSVMTKQISIHERYGFCYNNISNYSEEIIDKGIYHYKKILKWRVDKGLLGKQSYASTLIGLALLYNKLSFFRETRKNAIKAIRLFNKSSMYVKTGSKMEAQLYKLVGDAYYQYAMAKNPEENLIIALRYYSHALKFPENDNMSTHMSIGNCRRTLAVYIKDKSSKLKCLELAIKSYGKANVFITIEDDPEGFAKIHMNFGIAYYSFSEIEHRIEHLELSLNHFETSLKVFTKSVYPYLYHLTNLNFSVTLIDLYEIKNVIKYLDKAISILNDIENYFNVRQFPANYAIVQMNIGRTYLILYKKTKENYYYERSHKAFNNSLIVYTAENYPEYNRQVNELKNELKNEQKNFN